MNQAPPRFAQKVQINQHQQIQINGIVQFNENKWIIQNGNCQPSNQTFEDLLTISGEKKISFKFSSYLEQSISVSAFTQNSLSDQISQIYDLSLEYELSNDACKKAILYCNTGFVEVDKQFLSVFLETCAKLRISMPFQLFNNFFDRNPQLDLSQDEKTFNIIIYLQQCIENYSISRNTVQKVFNRYSQYLIGSNPGFFSSQEIIQLSENSFLRIVEQNMVDYYFPEFKKLTFDLVHIFYSNLQKYYSQKSPSKIEKNPERIFEQYYQSRIEPNLDELNKEICLQYLPDGKNKFINNIKLKIQQNQNLRIREQFFCDILTAFLAMEISKKSQANKFEQSNQITGESLKILIENQLQEIEQ